MDAVVPFLAVSFGIKCIASYMSQGARPKRAKCVGQVTKLKLYPVKSMGGIEVSTLQCSQKGFKYDDEPLFDR